MKQVMDAYDIGANAWSTQNQKKIWSQKKVEELIQLRRFRASHTLCVSLGEYMKTYEEKGSQMFRLNNGKRKIGIQANNHGKNGKTMLDFYDFCFAKRSPQT